MQPFCGPASRNLAADGRWYAALDNVGRSHSDVLRLLLVPRPRANTALADTASQPVWLPIQEQHPAPSGVQLFHHIAKRAVSGSSLCRHSSQNGHSAVHVVNDQDIFLAVMLSVQTTNILR